MSAISLYATLNEGSSDRIASLHRRTMSEISYAMELAALEAAAPIQIFGGFQRMQYFLPVAQRFAKLAERADVYVLGFPDVTPPLIKGLYYIPLAQDDPLTSEWFLIIKSPNFTTALVAKDQSSVHLPHAQRSFRSIWTHKQDEVDRVLSTLAGTLNLELDRYQADTVIRLASLQQMAKHLTSAAQNKSSDGTFVEELTLVMNKYIEPAMTG
jgi:DICT domain-containing protein